MATASVGFRSREEHRKQIELVEARKAGLAPAEVDENGNAINPHIPGYVSTIPWYIPSETPSLKHQKKWKIDTGDKNVWYDRGAKTNQAETYQKGACTNCGANTHDAKSCMERPRQVGAKFTNKNIAPDEKIESFELDYAGKRDRWNGYDPSTYHRVVEFYEAKEDARNKHLKKEQLRKLEETQQDDVDEEDDDLDEAKVDESRQMDFAKVEKRVRTTGGGSTGTVRNLRIREDTAKYLLNLDVRSAHYDPKARSMREDPLPNANPNDKFYSGDNAYRNSGQAQELKQMYIHSCEAFGKGYEIHTEAAPSQAEILYKNFMAAKGKLKSQIKEKIMDKYGNAASEDEIPIELLLGQSERQVEYDRSGRVVIKGQVFDFCCSAGIEAGLDLMNANIARKEESPKKRMATWGTDIPKDSLANALNKEDKRKVEEKDERKRKYNVKYNNEVTLEEMEAYRMKRVHHEDPMK